MPATKSCAEEPRQSQLHTAEASLPAELSEAHLNSQGKQGGTGVWEGGNCCAACPAVRRKAFVLSPVAAGVGV